MKKSTKPVAPVVELTKEMKEANKAAFIARQLTQGVERANALCAEFAAKISKSLADAEYALRWQQDNYETIRFGQYCESALKEGLGPMLTIAKHRLAAWSPENSSSPFSNACHNEEFKALRHFILKFEEIFNEEA